MANEALEKKKVMVAIDESESSYYALMWVLNNLQEFISKSSHPLILLTVLPPPTNANFFASSLGSPRFFTSTAPESVNSIQERNCMASSDGVLEKAKSICASHGINAEAITVVGNAKEAICDSVQKLKINLLVLGDHGAGKSKRTSLGSVNNYCVLNAKCTVLIVKKPA